MEDRTKKLSKQIKLLIKDFTIIEENHKKFACYIYDGEVHAIAIDSFEIDFLVQNKRESKKHLEKELLMLKEFREGWKIEYLNHQ